MIMKEKFLYLITDSAWLYVKKIKQAISRVLYKYTQDHTNSKIRKSSSAVSNKLVQNSFPNN